MVERRVAMTLAITKKMPFAEALSCRTFAILWSSQTISSLGDGALTRLLRNKGPLADKTVQPQQVHLPLSEQCVCGYQDHRAKMMFCPQCGRPLAGVAHPSVKARSSHLVVEAHQGVRPSPQRA
jgi:hypothetical protein